MRKHFWIVILIICIFFCGCVKSVNQDPSVPSESAPIASFVETTPSESQTMTEPITEPASEPETIPAPALLNAEPGAFLLHYEDEEIDDYAYYYIYVPEKAVENMPMIVFLHGYGETFNPGYLKDYGMINDVRAVYGEEFPFIVLYPNAHYYSWSDWTMPDILISLIDHVCDEYKVNRDKIILTGHSNGARGAWYMASEYSEWFSAVVPICGGSFAEVNCENLLNVSIRAFIGDTGEDLVGKNEMTKIMNKLQELGGSMELIMLKGTHADMKSLPFTKELFEWMMAQ